MAGTALRPLAYAPAKRNSRAPTVTPAPRATLANRALSPTFVLATPVRMAPPASTVTTATRATVHGVRTDIEQRVRENVRVLLDA